MKSNDDIWKKMTTPIEIEVFANENFVSVKERFEAHRKGGYCVKCPLSGTVHNMPYRRSISKGMARALKLLYRIQVERINDGTAPNQFADFTKLRYWKLIRQDETGHWRITPKGIDFVRGVVRVEKHAIVVNNVCSQFMGDELSLNEILSK